jgi:hypothetical protein
LTQKRPSPLAVIVLAAMAGVNPAPRPDPADRPGKQLGRREHRWSPRGIGGSGFDPAHVSKGWARIAGIVASRRCRRGNKKATNVPMLAAPGEWPLARRRSSMVCLHQRDTRQVGQSTLTRKRSLVQSQYCPRAQTLPRAGRSILASPNKSCTRPTAAK